MNWLQRLWEGLWWLWNGLWSPYIIVEHKFQAFEWRTEGKFGTKTTRLRVNGKGVDPKSPEGKKAIEYLMGKERYIQERMDQLEREIEEAFKDG